MNSHVPADVTEDVDAILGDVLAACAPGGLPGHIVDASAGRLLDALACLAVGRDVDVVATAHEAVAADSNGPATVLLTGANARPTDAAFVNAVASHAVLLDDIYLGTANHPGTVVVPAALAAAETTQRARATPVTIGDLLAAIVTGYEVQLALGAVAARAATERGWRTTSVFGVVGAAAAAAQLFGLPPRQQTVALGLAANLAGGVLEGWRDSTMEPFLQVGAAARDGLTAALLARAGATAAQRTFGGESGFLRAVADIPPGTAHERAPGLWRIVDVATKRYPVSAGKLTCVASAVAAHEQGIDPARIVAVRAHVSEYNRTYPGSDHAGPFHTLPQAQVSTQYCIAAGLLGYPMTSLSTFADRRADPRLVALCSKIELVGHEQRSITLLEIELAGGEIATVEVDRREDQQASLPQALAKFRDLGPALWRPPVVEAIAAAVVDDRPQPVDRLVGLLRRVDGSSTPGWRRSG